MRTIKALLKVIPRQKIAKSERQAAKEKENGMATLQCASNYDLLAMYSNTELIAICKECDERGHVDGRSKECKRRKKKETNKII